MTHRPEIPEHVLAAIERAKASLEERLLVAWQRGLPFKLWAEGDGEAGVLREVQWWIFERERMPAIPRVAKKPA